MKTIKLLICSLVLAVTSINAFADAKVMNPGEAKGQLIYLSEDDVKNETAKFKGLTPLSIPVFAELPLHLTVMAGAMTLKQQFLLSHVQLKSRARHTPNLDISELAGGFQSDLLKPFKDGDYVHMKLGTDGSILLEPSTEAEALAFYNAHKSTPVVLKADLTAKKIYSAAELTWADFIRVGSKAANYAELAKTLNTPERTVVRPGYAIPFYYYQNFLDTNPALKTAIDKALHDPMMKKVERVQYREEKLKAIREMILGDATVIDQSFINELIKTFDQEQLADGTKRKMKLRSSTNSEDLPNFNGAGLYDSEAYNPLKKDGSERKLEKKEDQLKKALRVVWASVWNTRAFDERTYFQIPHADVKMGIQVNLSFSSEDVDGVVVTKNILNRPDLAGKAVYIEAQRGDKYSVTNPEAGTKPEQILVLIDEANPLDQTAYRITILQKSNIADDKITILPQDNPTPIMSDTEIKDLAFQSLKGEAHFKEIFGKDNPNFALDLEFKVDTGDTKSRQVYLKQARPYID